MSMIAVIQKAPHLSPYGYRVFEPSPLDAARAIVHDESLTPGAIITLYLKESDTRQRRTYHLELETQRQKGNRRVLTGRMLLTHEGQKWIVA